jgi:hypothetical protein
MKKRDAKLYPDAHIVDRKGAPPEIRVTSVTEKSWKTLYRAAVEETDRSLLPQRVSEAEKAVLGRGRELLYSTGILEEEEKDALDDALYVLHALETAWQHTDDPALIP